MEQLMKISEFARLSGISRKLLIYYDRYGILCPKRIDPDTGYRYYSYRQMDTANVIVSLRQAGMSLDCIRSYLTHKSPERLLNMLDEQQKHLKEQINTLVHINGMIQSRKTQILRGISSKAGDIFIKECPSENLFLGPVFPDNYDLAYGWKYTADFYEACRLNNIQLGFSVNALVEFEQLQKKLWNMPSRYYCCLPKGQYKKFFTRPSGTYLIGTEYADFGCTDSLYRKMFNYIEKHNIVICGNSYEEYLIDEIAEEDMEHYLLQISIQVCEDGI